MKIINRQTAVMVIGLMVGLTSATVFSANAAGPESNVNFCVNKTTNVVTQKPKCSKTERALLVSKIGPVGPSGEVGSPGPAGASGAPGLAGSPGAPGSGISLSDYPFLWGQDDAVKNATCQFRWNMIMTQFNIEADQFGQPVRNKPWAASAAGSCNYPLPQIFELPRVVSITNLVHGTKTLSAAGNPDSVPTTYEVGITGMKLNLSLDAGWHLCTAADSQYASRGLAARQVGWTQTGANEVTFSGATKAFWDRAANSGDYATANTDNWPWFCGSDSRTSSGLGYRTLNSVQYLPLQFGDPTL